MKFGLMIYGSLTTTSGGYLYDRMLVDHLRSNGEDVEVVSLQPAGYLRSLATAPSLQAAPECDVLLQDELCHPSLLCFNRRVHRQPIASIVHNLRADLRSPGRAIYRVFERQYLGSVDAYVFNSEATRSSVMRLVASNRPQLVAVPGGDRLGEMTEAKVRARALQLGPLRLVFLANVLPGKGLDIVLGALRSLGESDFRLDIVGSCDVDPGYARAMKRRALAFGSSVQFHGIVDGEALSALLTHAHALVLPSYHEGFGIAYLEGMAHGLVAVGTTAGAIHQLVSDGVDGFLIQPGDVPGLRKRIRQLADDRRLLAMMGVAALQKYRVQPTWKASMERLRDFLLFLAGSGPGSGAQHDRQGER
jgi:glycosyltransferase involved in cell wall biosynthesis